MRVERRHLTLTLILLFVILEFQDQHICAVKGSSVVIHCSFYRPDNLRVKRVVWGHVKSRHVSGRVIFDSNVRRATTRYQYTGDKYHSCSLKIHKVLQNDAGKYIITFNSFKMDTWRGNAGPTLKVVDLKVLVTKTNGNETMKEGDFVNLTCLNRCDARDPASAFTWFKNGEPINEGPALYLSNISPANSGNYTCSLKTQAGTSSGVMHIDVECEHWLTYCLFLNTAYWTVFTRDILITATVVAVALLLSVTTVTAVRR
uniref:Ig-like domain-containing protein n=1 Tax=Anabas testudineus TaxID=64144 RepID=A0A7N5ZSY1_ANATE